MSHQRMRHSAKIDFAECRMSGTRQTLILPSVRFLPRAFCEALGKCKLCRVLDIMHSAKSLALGIRVVSGSESSEITGQDTGVRRRGVRRRKFLCSSSPSPASCVLECERVPGRSQQLVSRARLGRQEIRSPRRRCVGGGRHEPAFMAAAGASRSLPAA